jgi:mono/diheme cytochrome c family protein
MSGMPAWQHRLSEQDLWSVVAFVDRLPSLSAPAFRQWMDRLPPQACPADNASPDVPVDPVPVLRAGLPPPAVARGRQLMHQYACSACHIIPGVTGSAVHVGPPLAGLASRRLIAGSLPNTEDNLVRWLRDPASVDPATAMPAMGVSERDARDMAAYLGTLR